jgi:hypothetical protein
MLWKQASQQQELAQAMAAPIKIQNGTQTNPDQMGDGEWNPKDSPPEMSQQQPPPTCETQSKQVHH